MKTAKTDFNLTEYMQMSQKEINLALDSHISPTRGQFKTIHEAMRYSVFAGGKRLRPILCKAAYEIFIDDKQGNKRELERIWPAACALELIHTYSLIHDDLPCMDNDDFRRGKPTNHKVFGEAMAVLAGDGLLTLAFELLAKTPDIAPEILISAIQELARASGTLGLIGGQVQDLLFQAKEITLRQCQSIHEHKTAALIRASVLLGGILGEASSEEIESLSQFGRKIGLAFQIVDDILDVVSSTSVLGKTARKDIDQQKATYPALLGLEESKKIAQQLKDEAIESLRSFGGRALTLETIARYIIDRKF